MKRSREEAVRFQCARFTPSLIAVCVLSFPFTSRVLTVPLLRFCLPPLPPSRPVLVSPPRPLLVSACFFRFVDAESLTSSSALLLPALRSSAHCLRVIHPFVSLHPFPCSPVRHHQTSHTPSRRSLLGEIDRRATSATSANGLCRPFRFYRCHWDLNAPWHTITRSGRSRNR